MEGKTCTIQPNKALDISKTLVALKKIAGAENNYYYSYVSEVFSYGVVNPKFVEWYNNTHDKKFNLNKLNGDTLAKLCVEYYNNITPTVTGNSRKQKRSDKVTMFGYTDFMNREFGKKLSSVMLINEYEHYQNLGVTEKKDVATKYKKALKRRWDRHVCEKISAVTGDTIEAVEKKLKGWRSKANDAKAKEVVDVAENIYNALGGRDMDSQAKNIYAAWQEVNASEETLDRYFDEILCNKKCVSIQGQIRAEVIQVSDDTKEDIKEAQEENTDTTSGDVDITDVDRDYFITNANNHLGTVSTFTAHLGERIINYFNTLPKFTSSIVGENRTYSEDKNNGFGITDTMDAVECSNLLYGICHRFTNLETMIKTIEDVGHSIRGFESFIKLANDLREDLDFATELRTVFAKTVIAKSRVEVDGQTPVLKRSNEETERLKTLMYNTFTDLQGSLIRIDEMHGEAIYAKCFGNLNSLKQAYDLVNTKITLPEEVLEERRQDYYTALQKAKSEVVKAILLYCPSLSEGELLSFIELRQNAKGQINQVDNVDELVQILKSLKECINPTRNEYNNQQLAIKQGVIKNNYLDTLRREGRGFVKDSSYEDIEALYRKDYLSKNSRVAANTLIRLVEPYCSPKLQLTSPNVLGNNSSDVINNNYLTNIKKILDQNYIDEQGNIRNDVLEAWGRERLKSSQYRASNIFIEQYYVDDKTGERKVANTALFRWVGPNKDTLVLTEHAATLLKISLFDGASDLNEGTNALYKEMQEGSYLPSAFMAYFGTNTDFGEDDIKGKVRSFFCRTPSDAPKNFIVRAPFENVSGFLSVAEEDEARVTSDVNKLVNHALPYISDERWDSIKSIETSNTDNQEDDNNLVVDWATNRTNKWIPIKPYQKIIKQADSDAGIIKVVAGGVCYVFYGRIVKGANNQYLKDYKCLGVKVISENNNLELIREGLRNSYREELLTKDITYNDGENEVTIQRAKLQANRNHRIFQQLRNAFKQELINTAVAINYYFDTDADGWVQDANKKKNAKTIKLKEGRDNKRGYKFYHLGPNGEVLSGNEKDGYVLGGSVFHSTKFTLSVEETDDEGNVKVVKRNYLDPLISTGFTDDPSMIELLYGGASEADAPGNYLHTVKENGVVIDVNLTPEQQAAVDERLNNFVIDYITQAEQKINSKIEFITDNVNDSHLNLEGITDFAMNYLLFYYNSDDLLEGDTKFYLDGQTILKRAKEIQGSGVPYGITDYINQDDYSEIKDLDAKVSYLNGGTYERDKRNEKGKKIKAKDGSFEKEKVLVQDLFKGSLLEGVKQRTGFYGITIANTKMTNNVALESLVGALVNTGLTEDNARTILYGPLVKDEKTGKSERRGGFQNTKVNDAQSYITIQEFVRRIAGRGQLKRYMPLLEKVIAYDKYISDPEHNKEVYLTANDITQFIQVQKNFYYDMYYDAEYGIYVPRQIKNAEFVLVPAFIKGTELETVYNLMRKHGIDQLNTVETSKAANEDIITLWDNDGNLTGVEEFENKANRNKQIFSYKYLYTQQETPQHVNAKNKAGIQIVKKIVDNIPPGHPLYEKKLDYFRTFVANIRESFDNLMDELGIVRDENGLIQFENGKIVGETIDGERHSINRAVFFSKFRQELMRLGLDDNMVDYVTLDSDGEPLMPSCMNNVLTKLESVAQSMFNSNITRQQLPGFHAAQVTNIGWKTLGETIEKRAFDKSLEYHPTWYVDAEGEHISKREYNELSDEDKKKYKPDGPSPYIEIMLPASALNINRNSRHYRNMSDAAIIAELRKKGLDQVIGYRIPTEGKQSVCVMKVVGFTEDALGSTIVVPNDWVSQTGSDFDIDSVYGINFETYTARNGEIFKVEYKDNADKFTEQDWFKYIYDYAVSKKVDKNISGKLKAAVKAARQMQKDAYESIKKEEAELFTEVNGKQVPTAKAILVTNPKSPIKKFIEDIEIHVKENYLGTEEELYIDTKKKVKEFLENCLNSHAFDKSKVLYNAIEEYCDLLNDVIDTYEGADLMISAEKNDRIKRIYEQSRESFNKIAADGKLLSKEEYLESAKNPNNIPGLNSRRARNNHICQLMMDILSHPSSLEENLSRSNFDDITAVKNKYMNKNIKDARANRSAYNVFDQILYQEDATSGMNLKGQSVALDTLCSVCNTVQPKLTKPIYIVYDKTEYDEDAFERFDVNTKKGDKVAKVRHTHYGWSNDNRNIRGKILTAYSSQTTAYILDAIKEGAIPNVNSYTFSAFKTLLNIGSDYETAIPFIMQPAIKRIVDAYERHNSVFSHSYGNPIKDAIKEIATELGIEFEVTESIHSILQKINDNKELKKEFDNLFLQKGDSEIIIGLGSAQTENLPIIPKLCQDRLLERGKFKVTKRTPVEKIRQRQLLFDLGVVLSFNKLNDTAHEVGNVARCCNPDKFGAKQTVFSTNEVFQTIKRALKTKNGADRPAILTVNGQNMLEAIYPGIGQLSFDDPLAGFRILENKDVMASAYPPLNAYLRFASASSIIINREIFPTQHPKFVDFITGINTILTNSNGTIDEDLYNNVQRFVLAHLYNNIEAIKYPVSVRKDSSGRIKTEVIDGVRQDGKKAYTTEELVDIERSRIYGFSQQPSMQIFKETVEEEGRTVNVYEDFTIEDVNNPTDEELASFAKLSPAQKVTFIKESFRNRGIFDYITATLYNPSVRGWRSGMQLIEFTQDSVDENQMYKEFFEAFYSNNILVQMTALDLIKYAVVVEGLNMSSKGISKILDNEAFKEEFGSDGYGITGTGFVSELMDGIRNIQSNGIYRETIRPTVYENYLRSHKEVTGLRTLKLNRTNMKKYSPIIDEGEGTIVFNIPNVQIEEDDTEETIIKKQAEATNTFKELMSDAGIMKQSTAEIDTLVPDMYNSYIRVDRNGKNYLYKIRPIRSGVLLYPLNPLEKNESSTWSARESNNKFRLPYYFENIAEAYDKSEETLWMQGQPFYDAAIEEMKKENTYDSSEYHSTISKTNANAIPFNLVEEAETSTGMNIVLDVLQRYYENSNVENIDKTKPVYIQSLELAKYIFTPGFGYGTVQNIPINGDKIIPVSINKVNTNKINETYLKKDRKTRKFIYSEEQIKAGFERNNVPHTVRQAILDARQRNTKLDNLFVATPYTPQTGEALYSIASEADVVSLDFMKVNRNHGDDQAARIYDRIEKQGYDGTSESIEGKEVAINRELAKYAQDTARNLRATYESFIPDPTLPDTNIPILSDVVQDAMLAKVAIKGMTREEIVDKYHKTLNETEAFLKNFSHFSEIVTDDMSPELKFYINKIKSALEIVRRLPARTAMKKLQDCYLSQISTNPLIKDEVINLMDGFWRTTGSFWEFFDLQETSNPLLQTIIRDVMGDLETQNKLTNRRRREFREKINSIIKEARDNGFEISINDVVDENGRLIQDSTGKFIDDYNELKDKVKDAIRLHGLGSYEHLLAKNEFDFFKAKHIHQPAKSQYYITKATAEQRMLSRDVSRPIYLKYMKLYYQRLELLNYYTDEGLSPEDDKKLKEITSEIRNLTTKKVFIDEQGFWHDRSLLDKNDPEYGKYYDVYNNNARENLDKFLEGMRQLNDKYWQYDPSYGFDELLKINLNIIRTAENRDANGIPQVTQAQLDNDEAYQKAKKWIRQNAEFNTHPTEQDELDKFTGTEPSSIFYKLTKALKLFSLSKNATIDYNRSIMYGADVYDEYRIPDGRKLTKEQIAAIKSNQMSAYGIDSIDDLDDRKLISAAPENEDYYTSEYYNNITGNGLYNSEYFINVKKLNELLEPYTDIRTKTIHFERIPDTEEGRELLKKIGDLYQTLRTTKKRVDSTNGKAVREFIEKETEEVTNDVACKLQIAAALDKSKEYQNLLSNVLLDRDETGAHRIVDGKGVPNKLLYTTIKPKDDKWIDKEKTEAVKLINRYYIKEETVYWREALREAQEKRLHDKTFDFEGWWRSNHYYNPYTRKYELIECWTINRLNDELFINNEVEARWDPIGHQRLRTPRDGMIVSNGQNVYNPLLDGRNPDYNEDKPVIVNYVKGSGYDSNSNLNKYQIQLRDYIQDTLNQTAEIEKSQRYFAEGYLPRRKVDTESKVKTALKETGKLFGAYVDKSTAANAYHAEIGYDKDYIPDPPMIQLLTDDRSLKHEEPEPKAYQYENTEEGRKQFVKDHDEWLKKEEEVREENRKINNELLDKNWMSVLDEYLAKVGHYNAVLENKNKLYSALNMIRQQKVYLMEHDLYGDLKEDTRKGTKDSPVYAESIDKNLIEWYENFMRRILFDQYRLSHGSVVDNMNRLQGFTSADYMMLNYKGGIANVTVGEAGILSEAAATEYLSRKEWGFGTKEWSLGVLGYMARAYSDKAINKQDAIIKEFNVVDYDELFGVSRDTDIKEYSRRVRNFMFHPQTIGEHFMQNSVLFAMLKSHRIVETPDDPRRIGVAYMNKEEYIRYREGAELMSIFTEEQRQAFARFKNGGVDEEGNKIKAINEDPNIAKDYAWWKKDIITDFLKLHCNKQQRKEFAQKRKELRKKFIKEFNELTPIYDQLTLGSDGYMAYEKGSQLASLSQEFVNNKGKSKADILLGDFTERVRKVNNKIHGVYNKIGKAYIEREWYGALLMQYHKHLPMGLMKRFRRRGYYNEARGTVEKGYFWSLMDFLSLNVDIVKHDAGWKEDEATAVKALQFHLSHCFNYLANIKATWNMLPAREQENIARNLGDLVGTLVGVATVIALLSINGRHNGNDDDDILFNLALYEADRMASECFLYNPIGLYTEGKTLMSTPVAAQSIVVDGFNVLGQIGAWMFGSEHYSAYYNTGQYAGRNRLWVYAERRIPMWNGIRSILEIPHNNHYYKRGARAVTIIPTKDIADAISGK